MSPNAFKGTFDEDLSTFGEGSSKDKGKGRADNFTDVFADVFADDPADKIADDQIDTSTKATMNKGPKGKTPPKKPRKRLVPEGPNPPGPDITAHAWRVAKARDAAWLYDRVAPRSYTQLRCNSRAATTTKDRARKT
jgi:hypothetical protein